MKNLKKIISNFNKAKVLVVGDAILDQYIWGTVDRISPEAPVPVVWGKKRTYVPGGAANVANNITALEGRATLVGVTGRDAHSGLLLSELKKRKIDTSGIFSISGRQTIIKTRVIAGHQQVVRVDWEDTEPLTKELNAKISVFIRNKIKDFDAVIIEDYGKGVINKELLADLIALGRKHGLVINVDPKEDNFQSYRGVTSITPNRKELENAIRNLKIQDNYNRFKVSSDRLFSVKDIDSAARQILEYLGLDSILVTLGEQGMRLFEKGGRMTHIPTQAQEVFDVSGAGDTVIGAFTLALCAGGSKLEAAHIANFAAGIVVGKVGTATTDRSELLKRLK